jgi:N-formylglutamate deformylase
VRRERVSLMGISRLRNRSPEGAYDPREPYTIAGDPTASLVATAIHAGHDLRPEISALITLSDSARRREEDPFTDRIAACAAARVIVNRSRFEVDLNRTREAAVYRTPEDCWGLDLWRGGLPPDVVVRSLSIYDAFYEDLAALLDPLDAVGPFVVFDVHSYNHRRHADASVEAPVMENPDVNVGTGSMDDRWSSVVDALIDALDGIDVHKAPLDVRQNICFEGANLSRWVHERYPTTGCALSLEFKKTFMDERTGREGDGRVDELTDVLMGAMPAVLDAAKRSA